MYIKSKRLNVVRDDSGKAFVYHSLYNNPRVLDDSLACLIDYFSEPQSIESVRQCFDGEVEEVVREFISLGYLHDVAHDENEPLKLSQKKFLLKVETGANLSRLELAISNSCNLACPHCMHFKNNDLPTRAAELNMTVETAKKSIDAFIAKVKEQGNRVVRVHFGNGEPLMNWKTLSFVLNYCAAQEGIIFSYAINTNLTLLTREMAEVLKLHRVKISTSLDGTKLGNDLIRIDRKGNGTFDKIIEKFALLREIGYPVDGFSITATDKNFDYIDEGVIDLAKSLGVVEVSMDYDLVSSTELPLAKCIERIVSLRSYAIRNGVNFYGNWETPFRILMSSSWLSSPHAYCPAMDGSTLEFNVDGSIRTCGHTNTVVGQGCDLGTALHSGSHYIKLIDSRLPGNNKMCVGCDIEGACAGQCHVTIESAERDGQLMNNMCAFMKGATKELIKEYMESH